MEGRRRLLLLAAIVVAVGIGAVGITLVSLFYAGIAQERAALLREIDVAAGQAPQPRHRAELSQRPDGSWQDSAARVPVALLPQLAERKPAPGEVIWLEGDAGYLAVLRVEGRKAVVAWISLAELRAPYQRAGLYALFGILLLVAVGLWLFYRMTAPLLRSIELSEARYRMLFSSTAEGVLLVGDGIEECNERFCEMFGCRREEVLGLSWRDFFRRHAGGDSRLPEFEQAVHDSLDGKGQAFVWAFHPAGGELVTEVAMRSLRDAGRLLVLVSLRDVSERERTIRHLQATERALRESREKLARAGRSSALVELAAGIAHEVNQPLAAVANYAQATRRMIQSGKPCSDDVASSLDRIAEQAQRAGEAIHRIRALVQATPRHGEGRTCVNQLVGEVAGLLQEEVAQAGVRLVLVLEAGLPPVIADPLQLQQVLDQLLRNALDALAATPPGQREIRVVTRRLADDRVEVEVCDTGHGIAEDDRPHLFEPFYSTRENGMGMGLAISMSIIRSHQGELEVDDGYRNGACIRFRLPADISETRSDERCRNPQGT